MSVYATCDRVRPRVERREPQDSQKGYHTERKGDECGYMKETWVEWRVLNAIDLPHPPT